MEFFKKQTNINFIGRRRIAMAISGLLSLAAIVSLAVHGLNFGLDFTGGSMVQVSYQQPVEVGSVRKILSDIGVSEAVVQHFGTARDVLIRLPPGKGKHGSSLSNEVIDALRKPYKETLVESRPGKPQLCAVEGDKTPVACNVQVGQVEFIGAQVGRELATKGVLALAYTLLAILVYVMFRFEWRFSVGAIVATAHDVLLVFGLFSITHMEFSLTVLAAILAVLGYSLNDTIVVFDRIRENFRKMRRSDIAEVMNSAVNQTLSRTIMTSGTTMLTVLALLFFGGSILKGFSIALAAGIVFGTYSSIFIATPVVLALGVTREGLLPVKKEGPAPEQHRR